MNFLSQKNITILLVLVIVILGGYISYDYFFFQKAKLNQYPANLQNNAPIVFQPDSPTAAKYYPGGGNAMDFRDGTEGDFKISMENKNGNIILKWPVDIKAYSVAVYDLGSLANLQDSKISFQINNYDLKQPLTEQKTSSSLFQPYEVGIIPQGFFNNAPEETKEIFTKGKRYSIEIVGAQGDKTLMASYTFNY